MYTTHYRRLCAREMCDVGCSTVRCWTKVLRDPAADRQRHREDGPLRHGLYITRHKAKPVGSPPGYAPSRLLIIVIWSVNWLVCAHRIS